MDAASRSSRARPHRRWACPSVAAALDRVAARLPGPRGRRAETVLHVDRSFTIHGAGTVVTGTLWSGSSRAATSSRSCRAASRARARRPGPRRPLERAERRPARRAEPRRATAAAIAARRRVLAAGGEVAPTGSSTPRSSLRGADHAGARAVHHGTRETPARIASFGEGLWQLRLEQPLLAERRRPRRRALDRPAGHARRRASCSTPAARPAPGARAAPASPVAAPAPDSAGARARARTPPAALALEPRLRAAGRPPAARRRARRGRRGARSPSCARPAAPCASAARCTPIPTRSTPCATASSRSSSAEEDHARPPARRARHLAQVRPGAARGARRRARHAAPARRPPRAASLGHGPDLGRAEAVDRRGRPAGCSPRHDDDGFTAPGTERKGARGARGPRHGRRLLAELDARQACRLPRRAGRVLEDGHGQRRVEPRAPEQRRQITMPTSARRSCPASSSASTWRCSSQGRHTTASPTPR